MHPAHDSENYDLTILTSRVTQVRNIVKSTQTFVLKDFSLYLLQNYIFKKKKRNSKRKRVFIAVLTTFHAPAKRSQNFVIP